MIIARPAGEATFRPLLFCGGQGKKMDDNKPMDYIDDSGTQWIMAACGHRVGGSPQLGDKIVACPNCSFSGSITMEPITIIYPERLPQELSAV